jgi:hypothetical protein
MNNRHLIAHGKRSSNITIARLTEWLEKAVDVVEYVESQCRN